MNGITKMLAKVCSRFVLLCGLVWPVSGAVNISRSSKELVIVGFADGKTATYKNSIWIGADVKVPVLQIMPSELKPEPEALGGPIPLIAIHVNPNPAALEPYALKELSVSVDTALLKGDFKGELSLSAPPDSTVIERIPVTLRLIPKPNVVVVPTPVAFKGISCGSWVCGFSDFLLPTELNHDWRSWQLLNQTPGEVEWTVSTVTLRGDKSGNPIAEMKVRIWQNAGKQWVEWIKPVKLPAKTPSYASFQFDRDKLQADHYQGQYRIELKDSDPITVPFSFDVRDGPIWPLVVLLAGIVLGRIIQSTNTPRAQAQMRLMDRFQSVSALVERVTSATIRQSLRDRLDQIMVDIRTMSRSEPDLSSQLDVILRLAADSDKLDLVEPEIQRISDATLKASLTALLVSARAALAKADFTNAEKALDNINNGLAGGAPPPPMALSAPSVTASKPPAKPNFVLTSLSWLSGAEPLDGTFVYRYVRPFLFLLLLVLLASVGLYNSYVKNATFGVEGYFDYLSLFLWGISADVAQKTLQNLSLARNG